MNANLSSTHCPFILQVPATNDPFGAIMARWHSSMSLNANPHLKLSTQITLDFIHITYHWMQKSHLNSSTHLILDHSHTCSVPETKSHLHSSIASSFHLLVMTSSSSSQSQLDGTDQRHWMQTLTSTHQHKSYLISFTSRSLNAKISLNSFNTPHSSSFTQVSLNANLSWTYCLCLPATNDPFLAITAWPHSSMSANWKGLMQARMSELHVHWSSLMRLHPAKERIVQSRTNESWLPSEESIMELAPSLYAIVWTSERQKDKRQMNSH